MTSSVASLRFANVENGHNVPIDFEVTYKFANGVIITVKDAGDEQFVDDKQADTFLRREQCKGYETV